MPCIHLNSKVLLQYMSGNYIHKYVLPNKSAYRGIVTFNLLPYD